MKPMEPMKPMDPMKPMEPMDFGEPWWPKDLGEPASSGGQNDLRYAFFPDKRRLLIERDGKRTTYDSGEHKITGVSQQNAGSSTFSTDEGEVRLDDMKVVS